MSDKILDPEVYAILQALRAARRYLQQASPDCTDSFLRLASRRPLEAQQITGPARALRHYVQRVGWSLNRHGMLLIDPGTALSLRDADFSLIRQLLLRDWAADVATSLTRNNWRNAPPLDADTTTSVARQLTDEERGLLLREQAGGFLTQARKMKFNEDLDELCPLCGQPDTVPHRVMECPATENVRAKYGDVIAWLQEMDPIHLHLPFAFQCHEQQMTSTILRCLPRACLQIHPRETQRLRFYTDGSCLHPSLRLVRWAAFGVVQDLRAEMEWSPQLLLEISPTDTTAFHVAAVGQCPGRQSVQRAEVEAILTILEATLDADIYTDSAYALNLVRLVKSRAHPSDFHLHPNYDQILRLHAALTQDPEKPGFWKVKAHQTLRADMPFWDLWHATGNMVVDHVAKEAVRRLGGPLQQALNRQADEYQSERKSLHRRILFRVDLNKERTLKLAQAERPAPPPDPEKASAFQTLATWQVKSPGLRDDEVLVASFWGYRFASQLWQWLLLLKWPVEPEHYPGKTPVGITWTELTINFLLVTQELVPINTSQVQGKPCYEKPGPFSTVTEDQMFLPRMAESLRNCLRQMAMLHLHPVVPDLKTRGVRSLYMLHGEPYVHGFSRRPQMPYQEETIRATLQWLQNRETLAYPAIPERPALLSPFEMPLEFNQVSPSQLYTKLREWRLSM